MTQLTMKVLSTVNAPYGANLSAQQLAAKIVDSKSVASFDASVFAFFSEVKPSLQEAFIHEMGVNEHLAQNIASQFAALSGYPLALAA